MLSQSTWSGNLWLPDKHESMPVKLCQFLKLEKLHLKYFWIEPASILIPENKENTPLNHSVSHLKEVSSCNITVMKSGPPLLLTPSYMK